MHQLVVRRGGQRMLIITPKKYNWMHRKEPPPQPQLTNTNNRCEEVNSENIQASA